MDVSKLLERITINPDICHGKPCIRGLRYPVDMILELLSAGMSNAEILADYEDFVDLFLLRHQPSKLLLVATGNISNRELERLFQDNLERIVTAFETCDFVELDRTALICHR